jgi:hypothetical protein
MCRRDRTVKTHPSQPRSRYQNHGISKTKPSNGQRANPSVHTKTRPEQIKAAKDANKTSRQVSALAANARVLEKRTRDEKVDRRAVISNT